ncbi:acyl-CoA dehydrogenase family protein [Kineosporia mesophila]|uniref:Acyl-CoA dehydrogenase family protein n=1 Tax=Kineosporia mesophila TaxID=566012 RepID=A0ABP7ARP3_9ACTN|nr:acyl-CoA dehydrogenase family protein [Kineosporia mesophila]
MGTVTSVADSDDALNLVPAPVDRDVFSEDLVLVEAVERHEGKLHLAKLRDLGRLAGAPRSLGWAEAVDRFPPTLRTHDPFGRRVDEVDYHPAWHRLMQTGVRTGLTAAAWDTDAPPAAHTGRAAAMIIWSQVESGHLSSLSTSYAAIPSLRADAQLDSIWRPRLAARSYDSAFRAPGEKLGCLAGLAVTERQGGSDPKAGTTVASPQPDLTGNGPVEGEHIYRLTGQKWFVSSPMSDMFLVLATAPGGLTAFVVPRVLHDGSRNTWRLLRLKNAVGTRSNLPAEVELDGTWAARLGEEGRGQHTITGMLTASRLDAVLRSAGQMRQAVARAVHHCRHRETFGSPLADKPLMQNVLADLALESEAATVLAMRLAAAVDAGETELLRAAVPVAKFWICKRATGVVAEALECLGGNGFVEEHGLARVFRDSLVGPLWEGPGNISALDVLRAMAMQPRSMEVLLAEIDRGRGADPRLDRAMDEVAGFLMAASREARRDPAAVEAGARWMVERLGVVLQASLLVRNAPEPVSSTFLTTRVAGSGGTLYGTLPVGRKATRMIVERSLPG